MTGVEGAVAERRSGRVVVGFDGSPGSVAALDAALPEARRRGDVLLVVAAWRVPPVAAGFAFTALTLGQVYKSMRGLAAAEARRHLAGALEHLSPHPDVAVQTCAVEGVASSALVEMSKDADLLVVGRRGHHELTERLLGSTAHGCVARACCPVLVVPAGPPQGDHPADGDAVRFELAASAGGRS